MQFDWEGKTYTYDPSKITVASAIVIRDYTGAGLVSWENGVNDLDPKSIVALLWAAKAQNGEPCTIAGLEFSILDFYNAFATGVAAEAKAKADADKAAAEAAADVPPSDATVAVADPTSEASTPSDNASSPSVTAAT